MPFTIKVGGAVHNTDDLTLNEAVAIEAETGESWLYINPLRSAKHWTAIARAFLARTEQPEAVAKILGDMSLRAALDATEHVEDDLPDSYEDGVPKAGGGPSTLT